MSGYTSDIIAKRAVFDGESPLIDKPFTIAALSAKVREVLDRDMGAMNNEPGSLARPARCSSR